MIFIDSDSTLPEIICTIYSHVFLLIAFNKYKERCFCQLFFLSTIVFFFIDIKFYNRPVYIIAAPSMEETDHIRFVYANIFYSYNIEIMYSVRYALWSNVTLLNIHFYLQTIYRQIELYWLPPIMWWHIKRSKKWFSFVFEDCFNSN